MVAPGERSHQAFTAALGLLAAAVVGWLLWQPTYHGQTLSYDTLLYARGLWGVGHGELYNPVYRMHVFAIHGNFLPALMAPLTRIFPAASVLIVAQAAAFGALAWMIAAETARLARRASWSVGRARIAATAAVLVASAGSPLVLNAFLFDVRPDVLALPLLTAALLRASRGRGFDVVGALLLVAAALVREEYAVVGAAALVLAPAGTTGIRWRARLALAALMLGYLALYWLGIRGWLSPERGRERANVVVQLMMTETAPVGDIIRTRAELLIAFALSMGGLVILGWRWLGAALPGLAVILAMTRMHEDVIAFHYVQFCAPGLVVAGLVGWRRLLERGLRHWHAIASLGAAALCFIAASAAPGGGRFRPEYFWGHRGTDLAREMASGVSDEAGVVVPYMVSAHLADREVVLSVEELVGALRETGEIPPGVDEVVLLRRNWAQLGLRLVTLHGFVLVDANAVAARLTRARGAEAPWASVSIDAPCEAPRGAWPGAGLVVCSAQILRDGALEVALRRPSGAPHAETPLAALVTGFELPIPLLVHGGLIALHTLPEGMTVRARTATPLPPEGTPALRLVDAAGATVGALVPGDPTPRPAVPVP